MSEKYFKICCYYANIYINVYFIHIQMKYWCKIMCNTLGILFVMTHQPAATLGGVYKQLQKTLCHRLIGAIKWWLQEARIVYFNFM